MLQNFRCSLCLTLYFSIVGISNASELGEFGFINLISALPGGDLVAVRSSADAPSLPLRGGAMTGGLGLPVGDITLQVTAESYETLEIKFRNEPLAQNVICLYLREVKKLSDGSYEKLLGYVVLSQGRPATSAANATLINFVDLPPNQVSVADGTYAASPVQPVAIRSTPARDTMSFNGQKLADLELDASLGYYFVIYSTLPFDQTPKPELLIVPDVKFSVPSFSPPSEPESIELERLRNITPSNP